MNAKDKKALQKLIEGIEDISLAISEMQESEQEKFDNLPESLQESARGDELYHGIETLEDAVNSLDEVVSDLNEIAY